MTAKKTKKTTQNTLVKMLSKNRIKIEGDDHRILSMVKTNTTYPIKGMVPVYHKEPMKEHTDLTKTIYNKNIKVAPNLAHNPL